MGLGTGGLEERGIWLLSWKHFQISTASVSLDPYISFVETWDLWPFRHLIRVMRRHHLTKPYIPTHPPTYLSTSFRDHPLWVIYETISGRSYFGPKVWNWLNPIEKNHGTCHSSRVINYICHHHNTSYQRPRLSIGRFFPCHFLKVLKQEI